MSDWSNTIWDNMKIVYHKMGLSEEEINNRILCKTARVLEGCDNLDKCDKNE